MVVYFIMSELSQPFGRISGFATGNKNNAIVFRKLHILFILFLYILLVAFGSIYIIIYRLFTKISYTDVFRTLSNI